jgi:hypothetical protein
MNDWIVLPRKLLTEYGKILGAQVIAVYAWLVARADEDYSVTIAYGYLQDLWLTPYKLRKAVSKLETFGLIKRASKSSNRTYHLLWIPGDSWKKFEDAHPPYSIVRSKFIIKSFDRWESENFPSPYPITHMDYHDQVTLAHEIADTLNDKDAFPLYLSYARRYSEKYLRKMLSKAMSIPDKKIKRTRGALFTFLVQQNRDE